MSPQSSLHIILYQFIIHILENGRCTCRQGRTDARLGHSMVAIHSRSYWIINTLDIIQNKKTMAKCAMACGRLCVYVNAQGPGGPFSRRPSDKHRCLYYIIRTGEERVLIYCKVDVQHFFQGQLAIPVAVKP
jgi:hypothetical protein